MQKFVKACFLSALVIVIFTISQRDLYAAHIVGGDVYYTCLGQNAAGTENTFRFEVTLYRDSECINCAGFDNDAEMGIFRFSTTQNRWLLFRPVTIPTFQDREQIDLNDSNPCIIFPPNVGVEKASYVFSENLPVSDEVYMIAYQRCCRNGSISNIIDPGSTGAVFSVEITPEAQLICNNSPRFNEFPPVVICNGFDVDFDHSASDVEGHTITYEFCTPQASGGTDGSGGNGGSQLSCTGVRPSPEVCMPPFGQVFFQQPTFSSTAPLGGNPVVTINPTTGLISGIPRINGQYVVGVCAKEFDANGVFIGEIRRDFQFNVTNCEPTVFAAIASDATVGEKDFVVNSCGNDIISFENESTLEQFIQRTVWNFDFGFTVEHPDTRDIEVQFPGVGEYQGTMIVNPGLECGDTANIFVNVFPEVTANFSSVYDTCVAGPVDFTDMSFTGADNLTNWEWRFADGNGSGTMDPEHQYNAPGTYDVSLVVTDNNECTDESIQTIDWFPIPPLIIINPSKFVGCSPAEIFFDNLSEPINEDYILEWEFGDGETSDEISPTHTYTETGVYSVYLKITSPLGCEIDRNFANLIRVEPSPLADFTFSPQQPTGFDPTVSFFDNSIDANSWQWNFGGEGTSFDINPTYTFKDTGVYNVDLVVVHPSGCPDTASAVIDVVPLVTYFLPNAFSPNNDAKNDQFIGKGTLLNDIGNFSMRIWNRWGEQVFETEDPFQGWNGTKNNTGQLSPQGVYAYRVMYTAPRGREKELSGHVTLVR